ncbi:MAG: efflux RND transporter permease subunit [Chloroflexi bacterium]|nr:efflux RND transporter permease subunit [Chloroflexota bacterium]
MFLLTKLAVARRSVTILIALAIFGGGVASWGSLKQELLPNIDFPIVTIIAPYPGAGTADVADQVAAPIEAAVASVAGVESLRSVSTTGLGFVSAQFAYGSDVKEILRQIQSAIDSSRLPAGVTPVVRNYNINSAAVVIATLTPKGDTTLSELAAMAQSELMPALRGTSGISSADLSGGSETQAYIQLDGAKLAASGVSMSQVQGLIQANNLTYPGGQLPVGSTLVPVSATGRFTSVADLENLVVGGGVSPTGQPYAVLLKDVATVSLAEVHTTGWSETNGTPGLTISVSKAADANTVTTAQDAIAAIEEFAAAHPAQVKHSVVTDSSIFIIDSIEALVKEGGLGAAFAVLVIFIFLLNLRSTIVAAVSIPLSVLAAIILMSTTGITINIMTLGGLAVAVGRVVDDSIVVLENIYRHRSQGEPIGEAVLNGTREVSSAITSSTITTIAVFLPLGVVGGLISQFFLPFALTVTYALLASLVVALTVIPVLAYFLVKVKGSAATIPYAVDTDREEVSFWGRLYLPVLGLALRRRATKFATLLIAFSLFLGATSLAGSIPTQFLNSGSEKVLTVTVNPPLGTSTERVLTRSRAAYEILDGDPQVELVTTSIPSADATGAQTLSAAITGRAPNAARMTVVLSPDTDLADAKARLGESLAGVGTQGWTVTVEEVGFSAGANAISVIVTGESAVEVEAASDLLVKTLAKNNDLANVKSDLVKAGRQIEITVNPSAAALAGLTTAQVAGEVRNLLVGAQLGQITVNGAKVNLSLKIDSSAVSDVQQLGAYLVGSPRQVPLSSIATIKEISVPSSITRIDQALAANVTGEIAVADTGAVNAAVKVAVTDLQEAGKLDKVNIRLAGVTEQQNESFSGLFTAMAVAILLVYLTMVLVFNSLVDPLVIMFSLPLAIIGAFPALLLTNRPIGISALIGFLMLIGIVVTNAIVLLDRVEQLRHEGVPTKDALLRAGATRVRPILMTAVATILALLPLAMGPSEGSIIAAELGTVVIGGLLSSTLLTLLVVPVVYSLIDGLKVGLSRGRGAKAA